jgi:O-antigen/teichoic acid export membrane protein
MLMVGAAFPIFVHAGGEDEARLRYAIDRVTQASLLTGIALALGVAVGAEPIVVILGGEEFRGAADVLRIQAFVLVPAFLTQVAAFGLVAIHRQRSLVVINGIALATVLGLGVVLIGVGGDKGAAVAAVAGETALALAAWVLLLRARPALRPPSGPLARVLVAAVPGVLVALIPGLPPLIAAALAVLVFCGAAWALGAVPAELTQALLRRRGA